MFVIKNDILTLSLRNYQVKVIVIKKVFILSKRRTLNKGIRMLRVFFKTWILFHVEKHLVYKAMKFSLAVSEYAELAFFEEACVPTGASTKCFPIAVFKFNNLKLMVGTAEQGGGGLWGWASNCLMSTHFASQYTLPTGVGFNREVGQKMYVSCVSLYGFCIYNSGHMI